LDQDVYQVNGDLIRRWIADLKKSGHNSNAVNIRLAGVRSFFDWALGNRYIVINPTAGVRSAKRNGTARAHLRDVLTNSEVRRILAQPDQNTAIGKRDYAILALKAYSAARDIEIHRANLDDLRTQDGALVLYICGKGHDTADEFIVIKGEAEPAMYDWVAERGDKPGPLFTSLSNRAWDERLSLRSIRRLVKGYYKAAGVQGNRKTSHSLRHTAITNAIKHGAPIQKVKSMARHTNIETTMVYYHEVDRIDDPAEGYIDYSNGNGENGRT
jgi:site-specific recombinase XerD